MSRCSSCGGDDLVYDHDGNPECMSCGYVEDDYSSSSDDELFLCDEDDSDNHAKLLFEMMPA